MKISAQVAGAWVMHHDQKLSSVRSSEFGAVATAGRAARLLSAISKENEWTVSTDRVNALAMTNGMRRHEVPGLLEVLETAGVIDVGSQGISVLGVDQNGLFSYASAIFEDQAPEPIERAALGLAELASERPIDERDVAGVITDEFGLSESETDDLIMLSKQIGFVDHERVSDKTLIFNGSLFKRDNAEKCRIILAGLTAAEQRNLSEIDGRLQSSGCLPEETVSEILGTILWSKLHQIGYFQVSLVSNENGSTRFVTKPSALIKYLPGGLADMHDDAKALASSLTYGILKSNTIRGQIKRPSDLMNALIERGYVEGWVRAIKEDYKVLERRGVVTVTSSSAGNRLTLNKPEVGRMASDLIVKGDATEAAARAILGKDASVFTGPEGSRQAEQLKDIPETKRAAALALDSLRKSR